MSEPKSLDSEELGKLDLSLQQLTKSGKVDRVLAADIYVIARHIEALTQKVKALETKVDIGTDKKAK